MLDGSRVTEPKLKIQAILLHAALYPSPHSQIQVHLQPLRVRRSRHRRVLIALVDPAAARMVQRWLRRWRRIVEVGDSCCSPCLVKASSSNRARRRRRRRRRGAVPEPGPVPAVDVHVASEGLRGPELPLAEAAGVRSRRPREARREAAAVAPWLLLRLPRAPALHRVERALLK